MPANTPINYSNTVVADQFMSSDFQNINAFYNDYRQGDLEFRLIKQYTNSNVSHNTVYIDNPDFYHNRYLNAEVNVDYFLQLMDDVDANWKEGFYGWIDDVYYYIDKNKGRAEAMEGRMEGDTFRIPSTVTWEEKEYPVISYSPSVPDYISERQPRNYKRIEFPDTMWGYSS